MKEDAQITAAVSDPVAAALFGKTRRAVLAALFGRPEKQYFLREMSRLAGGGLGSVQRELQRLERAGLVGVRREGGRTFYQAVPDAPLFPELSAIIRKTSGAAGLLRSALRPLSRRIKAAFIYGSVAKAQQGSASDLDVMVIGSVPVARVMSALRPLALTLGRDVNPTVFTAAEFRRKLRGGNHFLKRLMGEEKLFVIGDDHGLEAMAR